MKATGSSLYVRHTRVVLATGTVLDYPREAIYVGGNARGVMASGAAGAIRRAGGGVVERRLREQMPLLPGLTYLTDPGHLGEAGVRIVAYGVISSSPGASPTRPAIEAALRSALEQLDGARIRTLTLPDVGVRLPGVALAGAADVLMDVLTTAIRRASSLDEVVIASSHPEYLLRCAARLETSEVRAE